jgi:hypothetical protein
MVGDGLFAKPRLFFHTTIGRKAIEIILTLNSLYIKKESPGKKAHIHWKGVFATICHEIIV